MRSLIGEGHDFRAAVRKIPVAAKCDASVLLAGETGTGKELFARAIHYLSARATRPFISVNCGAIPTELMENELFGHTTGAYTEAQPGRGPAWWPRARRTLFLDEIDSLPLLAQVKLLRFLQDREFRPLGSARARKADVRVIAADEHQSRGRAQPRTAAPRPVLPAERVPDLPAGAARAAPGHPAARRPFLLRYAAEFDKPVTGIDPEADGRAHQLRLAGRRPRAGTRRRASGAALRRHIDTSGGRMPSGCGARRPLSFREAKAREVEQFERRYLTDLLDLHRGNISRAARAAQKNRRAFFELLRKHGLTGTNQRTLSDTFVLPAAVRDRSPASVGTLGNPPNRGPVLDLCGFRTQILSGGGS